MSDPASVSAQSLSDALLRARRSVTAIAPLTEAAPTLTADDAYRIAALGVAEDVSAGARMVGHKIGLTAIAVQRQLGVDSPDYGALLDTMELTPGEALDPRRYIAARVECEIAFWLRSELAGPGVTAADVRAATEAVQPAIELVDSRIVDWRITLPDTVADRASSAGFLLGGPRRPLDELQIDAIEVELWRGDERVETGRSDAVLGDPCVAVAWLANALGEHGETLATGEVVLSGACTKMVSIAPGDRFRAVFSDFGEIGLEVAR